MAEIGFDVVRLNFSHGDYNSHGKIIQYIDEIKKIVKRKPALLLDTQGPEIRTGKLKQDIDLNLGDLFTFSVKDKYDQDFGTTINYKEIIKCIKKKDKLLVDDGLIGFEVVDIENDKIICKVLNPGILGNNKSVNLPNVDVRLPSLSKKDIADIDFGIIHNIDFIAVSFVKIKQDVIELREYLKKKNKDIQIISKIEHRNAIDNFDEILSVSDGIMVARGDLGVEIPFEQLPLVQKQIIKKCNIAGKPVIVATHLLESMINKPRPTRAEVNDVANAILSGADSVMLSGETAKGKYPVESLKVLNTILLETEKHLNSKIEDYKNEKTKTHKHIVSNAVALCTEQLKTKAIISLTVTGTTAGLISRYRLKPPVFVFSPNQKVRDETKLQWGVFSYDINIDEEKSDIRNIIKKSIDTLIKEKHIKSKDIVIITVALGDKIEPNNFVEIYS